ncbi:MAG TPA: HIT family protein [Acidimicrobiales bacterium]|nr:HIT family protein [Acidimicrobiales bacterium]
MAGCRTCELTRRRDAGCAPQWDLVLRTPSWDVAHAYGTSVEGWSVLVLRRHAASLAEMTDEEAGELGPLLKSVSRALAEVVGCAKTYAAQFAEDPLHRHVHFHVIPRAPDQPEDRRGPGVFAGLGVPEERCVPEARMNEIAAAMASKLSGPARDKGAEQWGTLCVRSWHSEPSELHVLFLQSGSCR